VNHASNVYLDHDVGVKDLHKYYVQMPQHMLGYQSRCHGNHPSWL